MQVTYQITPDDFVGFNLSYMNHATQLRASIRSTQLVCTVLILIVGAVLTYVRGGFSLLWALIYVAAAIAAYFLIPPMIRRRVKKSVYRTLSLPQNQHVCSEKTLTLEEDGLHLTGGGEDSRYPYDTVAHIDEDMARYFIYVGAMSAVIVPFSAFSSGEEKAAFYRQLCDLVEAGGGKVRA